MGALSDLRGRRQQEGAFHRDLLGLLNEQAEKDNNIHVEFRIISSPKTKQMHKVFTYTLIYILNSCFNLYFISYSY